jgi:hypothetical protein
LEADNPNDVVKLDRKIARSIKKEIFNDGYSEDEDLWAPESDDEIQDIQRI